MNHSLRIVNGPWQHQASNNLDHELRRDERYPADRTEVLLRTLHTAVLVDESVLGLAVILNDANGLTIGQSIQVDDGQSPASLDGIIRYLEPIPDGMWKAGIQLDDSHLPG
jgi:hypothetical protein